MPREPIPTWFIVLVVVRLEERFLLIHEAKHGQLWYLPAGRVEPGESFVEAARRETLEEAGISVEIEGLLRFEHNPLPSGITRVRVVMVARPAGDTHPKDRPDEESLEAAWCSLSDMERLPMRHEEVREICQYVAGGGQVYSLDFLTQEGAPYPGKPRP